MRLISLPEQRFPTMRTIGLAVQHFPSYIHTEPEGPHGHEHLEMFCVVAGNARSVVDGHPFVEFPGSVVILPFGDSHELLTGPEGVEVINVYLDLRRFVPPAFPPEIESLIAPLLPTGLAFRHRMNERILVLPENPERILGLLSTLVEEQDRAEAVGREECMTAVFSLFLLELARGVSKMAKEGTFGISSPATLRAGCASPAERMRIRLDFQPERDVDVARSAQELGISAAGLCRSFRSLTGRTILEYLHRRRIERSLRLLRTSERKIADIAFETGFRDLSFFNRKFRDIVGISPRDYRKSAHRPRPGSPGFPA